MKARARRGVREKRIIRGCSGLNPRLRRLLPRAALPAAANLREKLSRWNANLYAVAKIEKNRRISSTRHILSGGGLSSRLSR